MRRIEKVKTNIYTIIFLFCSYENELHLVLLFCGQLYLMFYQEYMNVVSEWTLSGEKREKRENQYMCNYYFFCSCENELHSYSIYKPRLANTSIMDHQFSVIKHKHWCFCCLQDKMWIQMPKQTIFLETPEKLNHKQNRSIINR